MGEQAIAHEALVAACPGALLNDMKVVNLSVFTTGFNAAISIFLPMPISPSGP
jgi:hypothetical protein